MSAKSAKGNKIKRLGICPDCGKEFDPQSFRVMIDKNAYLSYLCRSCAKKEGVQIVDIEELLKDARRKSKQHRDKLKQSQRRFAHATID